ncbi:MAG: hypothetical protein B7X86_06945 [Sphingobacteriales bacterium 17-39-43]|jgi:Flp pilus assembly protein TadB|uniref:hypothetical protein n=1 Tax=Daejeonella sp. TaxID=2805397 RepID=UPI000BDADC95|nr:hypothetical protein [Daejeonella sp.]OYZ31727.1 MAG: hypothetical protein B7Y24_07760 [Sphingobacteriales bacterium 16-39-50]OZA25123.1 MAG: hypothetical protein B7X86_06945 [Sphingobacteriales bacterium 17-39-43]HQS05978.1 hypothetical protein [Daejeonella sp.]HQS52097.1 hypothetical protein [Daejeonella sp.]HQT22886.1 hypothetical protein [Daejeonella sp.]
MRTILLFLLTSIIVTGIMLAGISMKNSTIAVPVAFGVLLLFVLYLNSRSRKRAQRKQKERKFEQWIYDQKKRHSY